MKHIEQHTVILKEKNGSESFPQQPSDMLQQEAQRRHTHAGRAHLFSCMNPQVCRLLDELPADATCWGSSTERACNGTTHGLHLILAKFLFFFHSR